jgi:Tfp pilus assembly protein PilF
LQFTLQLATALARHARRDAANELLRTEATRRAGSAEDLTMIAQAYLQVAQPKEAAETCRKALTLDPERIDTKFSLAMSLQSQGLLGEARDVYRALLLEQPQLHPAANNLAWLLASDSANDDKARAEAVQLATAICEATGRTNASFLDTLAFAQATQGNWLAAEQAALQGLQAAQSRGETELAVKLERRLQDVRQRRTER